jgi:hypothetical protein
MGCGKRCKQNEMRDFTVDINTSLTFENPKMSTAEKETFQRGSYGELFGVIEGRKVSDILVSLQDCLPDAFVDFDRRGRGDALNLDLYGWDAEEGVAVVQVRMAFRRREGYFLSVRKDYVLCGHNENGTPFRHPVSAQAVRRAINLGACPVATVRAAQKWMFGCTPGQLAEGRRQGDILIVAERGAPRGLLVELGTTATLAGTHVVEAERLVRIHGKPHLYALRPVLRHTKMEHRVTRAPFLAEGQGWFSVRVAATAPAWDYSVRMGD